VKEGITREELPITVLCVAVNKEKKTSFAKRGTKRGKNGVLSSNQTQKVGVN